MTVLRKLLMVKMETLTLVVRSLLSSQEISPNQMALHLVPLVRLIAFSVETLASTQLKKQSELSSVRQVTLAQ